MEMLSTIEESCETEIFENPPAENWKHYLQNAYSQNGEDGIIEEIFRRIGIKNKWCFEVGAADGIWFSNTRNLIDQGWNAVLMEADPEKFERLDKMAWERTAWTDKRNRVVPVHVAIEPNGPNSIDAILDGIPGFPDNPDLGVIDVDGDEYYHFLNLLQHRPRVVIIEFDPLARPDLVPERGQRHEDGSGVQAGADAMVHIALSKGYALLARLMCNLIFIENESAKIFTSGSAIDTINRNGNGNGKDHAAPVAPTPSITAPPVAAKPEAVAAKTATIKLNIGAGIHSLPGFISIDKAFGGEAFPLSVKASAFEHIDQTDGLTFRISPDGTGRYEFPDNSVAEIYASHILEHFSYYQTQAVLKEWVRVLAPGGILKIAVPDFDKIAEWYMGGVGNDVPIEQYLMGGQADDNDHHKAIFNKQKLTQLMLMAGLGEIQEWKTEIGDCARLPVSLNLMGVKGAGMYPILRHKVAACFSMPRLAFTDNLFCAQRALSPMQISTIRKSGVFWGQCLQGTLELQLSTGVTYLLTIDYDTIFTPDDVLALYRIMESHPEVDAVCAIQSGRDRATPLMTVAGPDGKAKSVLEPEEVASELLELRTGHFGLTMIRCESLKKIPKPWFMHTPDKDGSWGDGRVDDDIFFWFKFREHGLRLFQANRVVVGHAQLVFSWPGQSLETIHQYASDYETAGKPETAWR